MTIRISSRAIALASLSLICVAAAAAPYDGTDYIGKPAGWGKQQSEGWEEHIYHQPGDEIDAKWVFDGMIEDALVGFGAGWLVAQAEAMPVWNAGDEFEAARKKALAQ